MLFPFVGIAQGEQSAQDERSQEVEARALEMAGFRNLAVLLITSDPVGSQVLIDGREACFTPCKMNLPPGKHAITFRHREREEITQETDVTSGEQIQVHVVLGRKTSWKLILPTYIVGAVFTAGGISSILVHGNADIGSADLPADERRFHRNLGIASLAIGLPLLGLATYLVFAGRPGEVRTSVAPSIPEIGLTPLADIKGAIAGASVAIEWN
ncbi:MAG: PEGA domain-containing protein [Proteobacteria bacterium]|nr:PEGA domain-containing protein [Pseudomonadota bacterium]